MPAARYVLRHTRNLYHIALGLTKYIAIVFINYIAFYNVKYIAKTYNANEYL